MTPCCHTTLSRPHLVFSFLLPCFKTQAKLTMLSPPPQGDSAGSDDESDESVNNNQTDVRCLTGFSASATVASAFATDESRSLSAFLAESLDSDDDEPKEWGGSEPGKSPNLRRDFQGTHERLKAQHFNGYHSLHNTAQFKRRFRVSLATFERICGSLLGKGPFRETVDAVGKKGINPLVRMTVACRMLGCGTAADCQDEQWQMASTACQNAVKNFCCLLVAAFGNQHLNRSPTPSEKARILKKNQSRNFPGCFASWDCKHFVWDKCPVALQGQHKGHSEGGKHTKILEAIADDSCYFWFINFGDPGSLNDTNVLDKSSIVGGLLSGHLNIKTEPCWINGTRRDWMHFLVDGTHPDWAIFVKNVPPSARRNESDKCYSKHQEFFRKDIERAFGILVKKFHVLSRPVRYWNEETLKLTVHACAILHNMCCEERIQELGAEDVSLEEEDHERHCEATDPRNDDANVNSIFSRLPTVDEMDQTDLEDVMNQRFARANALHHLLVDPAMHHKLHNDLYKQINSKRMSNDDNDN